MKKGHTFAIAFAAVLTAFSLVILYAAAVAPTGRLGLVALAGLLPAASVVSTGLWGGLVTYGAVGLLGFLLLPDKGGVILYLVFFGLYPIVKYGIERLKNLLLEIVLKLLFCNGAFALIWFAFRTALLGAVSFGDLALWMIWIGVNVVFLVYDYGFSKLIAFYVQRVDRVLTRTRR